MAPGARVGKWAGRASILFCLALVGCGTSSPGPLAVISAVPRQTVAAGSARAVFDVHLVGRVPAENIRVSGDGAFDFTGRRGTFTLDLPEIGRTEGVVIGTTAYERIPQLGDLSPGKSWLRVDPGSVEQLADLRGPSSLVQVLASDPTTTLGYLRGVAGEVVSLGSERVRGVPTTHYRTVIDLDRAAPRLEPAQEQTTRRLAEVLGTTRVPTDLWVDARGRARRQQVQFDYSEVPRPGTPRAALPSVVTFTVELFDFGAPVKAVAPPDAEIMDFSRFLQRRDVPRR